MEKEGKEKMHLSQVCAYVIEMARNSRRDLGPARLPHVIVIKANRPRGSANGARQRP